MTTSSSPGRSTGMSTNFLVLPSPPTYSYTANTLLHSVHALTTRLHPLSHATNTSLSSTPSSRPDPPSGIEVLETENFRLQCFQTLTGTKFLLFTDPQQANVDVIVRKIYELYSDYVMKNPFYQTEMPVRCESFDRKLGAYLRPLNSR
jgi:trafficking protein particle complex subunit 4